MASVMAEAVLIFVGIFFGVSLVAAAAFVILYKFFNRE